MTKDEAAPEGRHDDDQLPGSVASPDDSRLVTVLLTPAILRELRLALLERGSSFSFSLTLIEEAFSNGDMVVRLGRPDMPHRGERILGCYRDDEPEGAPLFEADET
jgi:hypothetical protein